MTTPSRTASYATSSRHREWPSSTCSSGYPNALAWSNLWIILRLKNTAPHVKGEIAEYKRRWKAERDGNKPATTLAAERAERRAGRARGGGQVLDDPDERWYVNLKNRVTRDGATYGVLTKQWRRTLHNVAAEDMAAKPHGRVHAPKEGEEARIEAEESEGDLTEGEEATVDETKEEGGGGDEADDEQDDGATSTTELRSRRQHEQASSQHASAVDQVALTPRVTSYCLSG